MQKRLVILSPSGQRIEVNQGTPLKDVLTVYGIEYPCGGNGRCGACKVRVVQGRLSDTTDYTLLRERLGLADNVFLSCMHTVEHNVTLAAGQWEMPILADNTAIRFVGREGFAVACDVGSTTIVAQLLDLSTGHVVDSVSRLNPQAQHGADIISRIEFALNTKGRTRLNRLIVNEIGSMINVLCQNRPAPIRIDLAGNTVMHHLFADIDITPLSAYPFESPHIGTHFFSSGELGWSLSPATQVCFLPCIGGYVGSDILAGIMAVRMHERDDLTVLIDLGTNGEIAVGNRHRILCASTAAGPAFEGMNISCGMRASTGAVCGFRPTQSGPEIQVIGNEKPRGVCGSGLADVVAYFLDNEMVDCFGTFAQGDSFELAPSVVINQKDMREFQLAKAAIAAGIRILLKQIGAEPQSVSNVFVGGAFGNYLNKQSLIRTGILTFSPEVIHQTGNTALQGIKAGLAMDYEAIEAVRARCAHFSLESSSEFQDIFTDEMLFL